MPRAQPCILGAALAVAGGLVSAYQQPAQQPRPTFRAGVDLVQVDVVVVDKDGNPVHGLTKNDFILIDKDVPQPIATFSEIAHDRPPAQVFPPGLPLDVASNQTAKADRLVMLVLDDLHFRGRAEEAKGLVRLVVHGLEGGASLGLVTTSGAFGVEITEDRERLLLEINNFLDHYDPHVGETPNTPVVNAAGTIMRDPGPNDPASFFSEFHAFKTIEDVARMMGANDGRRKAMILISAGIENVNLTDVAMHPPKYGLDPCWDTPDFIKPMHCGGLNGMYDGLHRSSVAVYPVDPGGPKDRGASLDPVARETGGFAVHANDLEAGMARLLADLDSYYLLGFYPADPKDKKYHPLDVRVNRPGLTVRHRHGYQPAGPPPPPKNDKPLEQAVAPVMPKTDLPLRLGAVPLFGSGSKMQVLATLEVGVEALPSGGPRQNDTVEFAVYAADLKKKKVTASDSRRLDVQWTIEPGRTTGSFRVQSVLALPPGPYQLRASAISKAMDKTGSVYLQIDVPDLTDAPLALGGIALTPAHTGTQESPGPLHTAALQGVSLPFAPALTRVFNEADDVRVFVQVKRATAAAPVSGTVAIVAVDGSEPISVPWTLAPGAPSSLDLTIPLAGTQAGPYRLVIKATDGTHQGTREVAIRVE